MILIALVLAVSNLALIFVVMIQRIAIRDLGDRVRSLENTAVGSDGLTGFERQLIAEKWWNDQQEGADAIVSAAEAYRRANKRHIIPDGQEDGEPG